MKDFDKWNNRKKMIDQKVTNTDLFFSSKEVWWCSVGLNIGIETDGKNDNFERPILIIKKFNKDMIWIVPLTTKGKDNDYFYRLDSKVADSWAMVSQVRTISTKRLLRKIETVSDKNFSEVIKRLQMLLKSEDPLSGDFSEAEATNEYIVLENDIESSAKCELEYEAHISRYITSVY